MTETVAVEQETETVAQSLNSNKIYCANCIHCKIITAVGETNKQFYLRVRCDAGKWKKKLGEEKIHKYFTVTRRSIDYCDMYDDMGDAEEFIRDLQQSLPSKDESYDKWF